MEYTFARAARVKLRPEGGIEYDTVFSAAVGAARNGETKVLQSRFEEAIQRCLDVKKANQGEQITISKRIMSAEEIKENLEKGV